MHKVRYQLGGDAEERQTADECSSWLIILSSTILIATDFDIETDLWVSIRFFRIQNKYIETHTKLTINLSSLGIIQSPHPSFNPPADCWVSYTLLLLASSDDSMYINRCLIVHWFICCGCWCINCRLSIHIQIKSSALDNVTIPPLFLHQLL